MKYNYFPKQTKISERSDAVLGFANLLFEVWLKRRQLGPYIRFSISSIVSCCFWLKYVKKLWTDTGMLEGKSILIAFLDNCGSSFLILYKSLTREYFLKSE